MDNTRSYQTYQGLVFALSKRGILKVSINWEFFQWNLGKNSPFVIRHITRSDDVLIAGKKIPRFCINDTDNRRHFIVAHPSMENVLFDSFPSVHDIETYVL